MKIRPATTRDIDAVARVYTDLLLHQQRHGNTCNWVLGVYPTRETAVGAEQRGALFVYECDGEIAASMIVDHRQLPCYEEICWQYPAEGEQVLVIHTLCVDPARAGRGIGRQMVRWAMELGRARGCRVLRIDTWRNNRPAAGLYTSLGFRFAGERQPPGEDRGGAPGDMPLIFFEYDLSKQKEKREETL